MLTPRADAVDAAPVVAAVTMKIAEIATRDGISKQAVSKRVRSFVRDHDLEVTRNGRGEIVGVNVAQYDHLRERYADPSKAQASAPAKPPPSSPVKPDDSYDEALRLKTSYEAERKRLELEELKGQLVRIAVVRDALAGVGEIIAGIIDRLPNAADDLAATVARDGTHGLRLAIGKEAARLRRDIAAALTRFALGQPDAAAPAPTDDAAADAVLL